MPLSPYSTCVSVVDDFVHLDRFNPLVPKAAVDGFDHGPQSDNRRL